MSKGHKELPFEVGRSYFIRTVTYHLMGVGVVGRVKDIVGDFLVLEDASWVADSGRFSSAIIQGILQEVGPVGVTAFVNANAIADAFDWQHKLPKEVKPL